MKNTCTYCARPKPSDAYKQCPGCREKRKLYMRKYYIKNKESILARNRNWRRRNPDQVKEINHHYYRENKEKVLAQNAEWRKNNPVKLKAQRDKWRNDNRERHRENSRKWTANNPERFREIQRHAQIRRRFLKAGLSDNYTEMEWLELLHEYDCKCAKCGDENNIEVDHVVPLVSGGTNTIDNIQPLCRSCNAQKWTYEGDYRIRI